MATEIWINISSGKGLLPEHLSWTNVDFSVGRFCYSPESFTVSVKAAILYNEFEKNDLKLLQHIICDDVTLFVWEQVVCE